MKTQKIKLSQVKPEDYEASAKIIDERLKSLDPIPLSFDMGTFFENISGHMGISARPDANSIIDTNMNYNELVFGIKMDEDIVREVTDLIKTRQLNRKTTRSLRGWYQEVFKKEPQSLEAVFNALETDEKLFEDLMGFGYRVGFYHGQNILSTDSIYSGKFKGQGLMTGFYQNLGQVIDFNNLDLIKFGSIVEKGTTKISRSLENIPNGDYFCEKLQGKYVRSPFMRCLNRLGFKDIEVLRYQIREEDDMLYERHITGINGRKSDELKFSVSEPEDD